MRSPLALLVPVCASGDRHEEMYFFVARQRRVALFDVAF
jgi:hypothetical protein